MVRPPSPPPVPAAAGTPDRPVSPDRLGPADPPLRPVLAVASVVVFTALGVMTAVVEVLLVPLRVGGTLVPLTVALAALTNGVLPVLSRRAVDLTGAAVAPVAAWLLAVVLLSQSRPEGDLLLPAISPLTAVIYSLLGAGALGGLVGVTWAGRRSQVRPWPNR